MAPTAEFTYFPAHFRLSPDIKAPPPLTPGVSLLLLKPPPPPLMQALLTPPPLTFAVEKGHVGG